MGPTWGRQDPGGPHVGPMALVIWAILVKRPNAVYRMIFESGKDHTHASLHCYNTQTWNWICICLVFLHCCHLWHTSCVDILIYLSASFIQKVWTSYVSITMYNHKHIHITPGKTIAVYVYTFNKQILCYQLVKDPQTVTWICFNKNYLIWLLHGMDSLLHDTASEYKG